MNHIEIKEIEDGYVVELFDSDGPADLDKKVFRQTFKEVLDTLHKWKVAQAKETKT